MIERGRDYQMICQETGTRRTVGARSRPLPISGQDLAGRCSRRRGSSSSFLAGVPKQ